MSLLAGRAEAQSTCLCDCYFDRDCAPGYFCDFRVTQHGGSCMTNNIASNCGQDSKVCDGVCTLIPKPTPRCADCQDETCSGACSW